MLPKPDGGAAEAGPLRGRRARRAGRKRAARDGACGGCGGVGGCGVGGGCVEVRGGAAGAAGVDGVKLQIIDADRLVSDKEQLFSYSILNPDSGEFQQKTEPLYQILKRRQLSRRELEIIAEKISSMGMEFFATVSYEEDIELVKSLECASVKIASADVNHAPLLRSAARSGMSVQLDTGNSTIEEISYAVDLLESENCHSIIIHHCPSGYPAYLQSISLRTISEIQKRFHYLRVGLR